LLVYAGVFLSPCNVAYGSFPPFTPGYTGKTPVYWQISAENTGNTASYTLG
jgi:hypothetical protein